MLLKAQLWSLSHSQKWAGKNHCHEAVEIQAMGESEDLLTTKSSQQTSTGGHKHVNLSCKSVFQEKLRYSCKISINF